LPEYIDFDKARLLIPMADVLALIGWRAVRLDHSGARGPCPIHHSSSELKDHFAANARGFYCFKCHANGSQLTLYSLVTGRSVYDATKQLCWQLGIPLPTKRNSGGGLPGAVHSHPKQTAPCTTPPKSDPQEEVKL
jgi:hypothetical protein